jgi:hypothetical protein
MDNLDNRLTDGGKVVSALLPRNIIRELKNPVNFLVKET